MHRKPGGFFIYTDMSKQLSGYELSRTWFDWCFENPEKINPNHTAIYMFAIEHCNRLGWRLKFGFPSQMTMDALGIKKHGTYIKYFNELVEWGFFDLIQKSTNQYSSNIISLKSATPKNGKALDKAFLNHRSKQNESKGESNSSIDKQLNNKQLNQLTIDENLSDLENKVLEFYNFRKSMKKPIREESKEAWINKLIKLSNGDEETAILILDESIANGYQGIFELKTNKNGTTKNGQQVSKYEY